VIELLKITEKSLILIGMERRMKTHYDKLGFVVPSRFRWKIAIFLNWWYGDRVCWADLVQWSLGYISFDCVKFGDPDEFDCDYCMKHYRHDRKELWEEMTGRKINKGNNR
jgi:hypothetical protein